MGTIEKAEAQVVHRITDDPASPVVALPHDPEDHAQPTTGIGLCMSGGGYRAMLFHLGSLWRLNELGLLSKLTRISSVSGGSITSARLGLVWKRLAFVNGVATAFGDEVVTPIRKLAGTTIDRRSVLAGAALPGITASDLIEREYRKHLFDDAKVADLPDGDAPTFVINAANVQTGALFRFERDYVADWRIGINRKAPHEVTLAKAVAASSAFAPVLSPAIVKLTASDFEACEGADLSKEPYTSRAVLTDGGNYDNLGLETVFKRCETVFVSDAVGALPVEGKPDEDWLRHGIRAVEMLLNQIVSLRKRQLLCALDAKQRRGAYWGIRSDQANYQLADAVTFDAATAMRMAETPTRLKALEDDHQQSLINWGYAIADTAIRKHYLSAPPPQRLPY